MIEKINIFRIQKIISLARLTSTRVNISRIVRKIEISGVRKQLKNRFLERTDGVQKSFYLARRSCPMCHRGENRRI